MPIIGREFVCGSGSSISKFVWNILKSAGAISEHAHPTTLLCNLQRLISCVACISHPKMDTHSGQINEDDDDDDDVVVDDDGDAMVTSKLEERRIATQL